MGGESHALQALRRAVCDHVNNSPNKRFSNILTLRTRAREASSFNSTTPMMVSPSRYADFVKVKTATLSPSLFTSYDTVKQ